jgi:hypothetical protein
MKCNYIHVLRRGNAVVNKREESFKFEREM